MFRHAVASNAITDSCSRRGPDGVTWVDRTHPAAVSHLGALNLPRTQLSNIIQLPPNLQSRSNSSVLPTSGEIRIADPQNIPISKSVSDAFSMDSGVNSLFGDEINDLIDALPIDEMIPSSPRPSFDRVGTDASSRALEDAVGQQRSATPPPPKRRR